ncbi:hypothetical protein MAINES_00030 [Brevundimonas phage vB_BpoS-MaInes]|nr:hypothetical protein MAINES_00030 [Brevundimonas phage vB_BpoS-MaInes]
MIRPEKKTRPIHPILHAYAIIILIAMIALLSAHGSKELQKFNVSGLKLQSVQGAQEATGNDMEQQSVKDLNHDYSICTNHP